MSSSFELESSFSDDYDESLQDAQSPEEQPAHQSPHDEEPSDEVAGEVAAELPPFASAPAKPIRLTKEEREEALREHAIKHNATLELDGDGQLQPVYPPPPGDGIFTDKPSAALWRHRTTFEQDIVFNLHQARASDLSIHLYNAFALRQRAKSQKPDENDFVETKVPPRAWAAWPATQDYVPRSFLHRPWDDDDWRLGPYVKRERRPGDELRELLTAQAMKTAKERFSKRVSEASSSETESYEDLRPTISLDDEAVEKTLQPSVQHLLATLDNLLVALHTARSSYIDSAKPMRKKRLSKAENLNVKRARSSHKRTLLSTKGGDNLNESSSFEDEADETGSPGHQLAEEAKTEADDSPMKNRIRLIRKKAIKTGLRDWTDIVGVASMTAVRSAVINKTTSRCVELFSEHAQFRTLPGVLTNEDKTFYLPHTSTLQEIGVLKDPQGELHDGVHVDGFMQTIGKNNKWQQAARYARMSHNEEAAGTENVDGEAGSRVNDKVQAKSVDEEEVSDDQRDELDDSMDDFSDDDGSGGETDGIDNSEEQEEELSDSEGDSSNKSEGEDELRHEIKISKDQHEESNVSEDGFDNDSGVEEKMEDVVVATSAGIDKTEDEHNGRS